MIDFNNQEIHKGDKIQSAYTDVYGNMFPVHEVLSIGDDTVSARNIDNPEFFVLLYSETITTGRWTVVE